MSLRRDQVVVIDLEATCWKKNPPPGQQSEIIEIGVCVLDLRTLQPAQKRSLLVKPTRSTVSEFCTGLTSLSQAQVDAGTSFAEACATLRSDYDSRNTLWASWGDYDQRMFRAQSDSFSVPYPFSDYHVNLKQLYADLFNRGKRRGLATAMKTEKIAMEGRHHRGDDDAWNTARFLAHMLRQRGDTILNPFWDKPAPNTATDNTNKDNTP